MNFKKLKIALAQTNLHVGSIEINLKKIIQCIKTAKDIFQPDIIIFPELAITGYPPEDLLLRTALYKKTGNALDQIITESHDIDIIIGYPKLQDGKLFNACSLLQEGEIQLTYYKQHLPNYGVFDEKRYFEPGNETCVFDLKGIPTALSICEDIWEPGSCAQAKAAGAKLIININASPYHTKKANLRKEILQQRVTESNLNIIYVNLVGGQDELVFDGGSMAINNEGEIVFCTPQFQEGLFLTEFSCNDDGHFSIPENINLEPLPEEESIYQALMLGVKDYVMKNNFEGAIIGLSGGIDSALTLCIAVDALGKENIEALMMPSRYTSSISIEDARAEAENLDVAYYEISIDELYQTFNESLQPIFKDLPVDTTEENIQARCRGTLLMAVSNKTGKLVLATGNKSEMAVGYATLYGDMAGGFAPLKDIPKTVVYKLANWRNQQSPVIPQRVIDRPPSAELREDQCDEDSLPPYDILDPILERYIELDQSPEEIISAGFDKNTVHKIVMLVDHNEYKRRQAAPGVRISQRAFGRDRRYPITSGYREY
jgi:NAD+ synthase (glutamine-hydrolysing)